ncbi:acyl carrier protein [Secundilactobacillus oryzae JCM 18671]|uniref:Acyl carrier protein n=1 Tax=Secundilactobacillus oryzae JCM 18671 TaxID=1291743 RepID=A0A081BFU3_9LACO|nr:acyl carrier protein [Secundilactobacillus oryzae]GAK46911.1 acyl carrier protein [Secundilactobacillus oryzae JCM 18671]
MSREEIFNKIASILAERFEIDKSTITEQLNFKNDLDADSIDFVEFVLELEDTFNAEISDEDAENLNTIGEVVDYIANKN